MSDLFAIQNYKFGNDREQQLCLLKALGVWDRALRRDECGDWRISGRTGWIITWGDGNTWCVVVGAPTARAWGFVKKSLDFAQSTQDGDNEGVFRLRHLPNPAQARPLRRALGIRKKVDLGTGSREVLSRNGFGCSAIPRREATTEGITAMEQSDSIPCRPGASAEVPEPDPSARRDSRA